MISNLRFTKMQALGNDFVVLDLSDGQLTLDASQIQALADRHLGIGFDQLLVISPSDTADYRYQIFNADGSEVAQCGNGARAIGRFIADKYPGKNPIRLETSEGLLEITILPDQLIRVNMGMPLWVPSLIPLAVAEKADAYSIEIAGQNYQFGAVSMGNPHAVFQVDDVMAFDLAPFAKAVQASELFPEGVNVGIFTRQSDSEIQLRVYERGSGETLACGSGACAAVAVGRKLAALDETVLVHLPGGTLSVSWQEEGQPVWKTGPADFVFEGQILAK